MADDAESGKVVFELDVENGKFNVKMGGVNQSFEDTKKKGEGAFSGISLHALGLNAALEVGEKLLHTWEASMQNLEKVEAFKNQEVALKNLGSQVGLTGTQLNTLVDLIKKATDHSVTQAQATETAFKLMNAGFKAETIPTLAKYAETLEKARAIPFEQTINAFSTALMTGNTRGLRPFEISLAATGDRASQMAQILKSVEAQTEKFGTGYSDTAARIKVKSEEAWLSVKKLWAGFTESVAVNVLGDATDKASQRVDILKKALNDLDERQKAGAKTVEILPGITTQVLSIDQARAKILEEINAKQTGIAAGVAKETEESKKQLETIKQQKELKQVITPQLQAKEAAKVEAQIETERYMQGKNEAKDYYKAKKALIDASFQETVAKMAAEPQTQAEFHAKLLNLERKHRADVAALRVDDKTAQAADEQAQLNVIESGQVQVEGSHQKHQEILISQEQRRYDREKEDLRMAQLDKTEYYLATERAEAAHQAKIAKIQQQHYALTSANIKRGWADAMSDMEKRQGGWAGMTQRIGTKTANVMSKSFIDMAKAHKFSMDQMLNNFLEMIGEELIQDGSFKLLAGLFPPNPGLLGVGAAEVAAGSALVGASSSSTGASSGGGSIGASDPSTGQPAQLQSSQMAKKSAQIVVNGDLLNSRETANHLQEIIRQNSDVTDYAIVAQGKQF